MTLWANIGNALGGLSALFKRYRSSKKAAALAEIAIGSAIGLINGLDIAQKSAKGGPAAAFAFPIFYATQVAAVLVQVEQNLFYLVLIVLVQVLLEVVQVEEVE
jgi:hypothetical protein